MDCKQTIITRLACVKSALAALSAGNTTIEGAGDAMELAEGLEQWMLRA